jgi:hypothetical protein
MSRIEVIVKFNMVLDMNYIRLDLIIEFWYSKKPSQFKADFFVPNNLVW